MSGMSDEGIVGLCSAGSALAMDKDCRRTIIPIPRPFASRSWPHGAAWLRPSTGAQPRWTRPTGIYADYLRLIVLMEEHGADLRLPHSRAMGDGLFELRCRGEEGIGRAFYCTMVGRQIVILHGFIKKTQDTPDRELKTARQRLKEIKHG